MGITKGVVAACISRRLDSVLTRAHARCTRCCSARFRGPCMPGVHRCTPSPTSSHSRLNHTITFHAFQSIRRRIVRAAPPGPDQTHAPLHALHASGACRRTVSSPTSSAASLASSARRATASTRSWTSRHQTRSRSSSACSSARRARSGLSAARRTTPCRSGPTRPRRSSCSRTCAARARARRCSATRRPLTPSSSLTGAARTGLRPLDARLCLALARYVCGYNS